MHIEEFSEGTSPIHRCDPRVKIIIFLYLAFSTALTSKWQISVLNFLYALLILFLSNLPWRGVFKRLFWANVFLSFILISLIMADLLEFFANKDSPPIKRESLALGSHLILKLNGILIAFLSLLGTTSISQLVHALNHLKIPPKFLLLLFLSYRYLTYLHLEYDKMRMSILARGFSPKTNLWTFKTYAYSLGILLVKTLRRSEELYLALLARNFKGVYPLLEHFAMRRGDLVFLAISMLIFNLSLWWFHR
ncbi:MAG: cobalt ECF transporter T component CbiQ [Caldimicrobium sp.]|nr:cobalt ECF transporter T component CbiQ [Caldimicrobium sp.]MCX7613360.1 cobalt ECF transporter T component CbiQ [Caldimicrobium sp.]MDW8182161.1 cobalt ECF transporter T component CbiQ [Caldimicrobium sp.]